jgi:hypothetical protein
VAVKRRQVTPQITEIKKSIYTTQQMIGRNVTVEIEGVEQLILRTGLLTHHLDAPCDVDLGLLTQPDRIGSREFFNGRVLPPRLIVLLVAFKHS